MSTARLSVSLSIRLFVRLFVRSFICPSVFLSVRLTRKENGTGKLKLPKYVCLSHRVAVCGSCVSGVCCSTTTV